jgi:imidazole glycerol-phosphate synthase subunit HisH
MIAIIDYGMGNLRSVEKAFSTVGHKAVVTRDRRLMETASHLVLPGVGAFADCMANLQQYDLLEPIRKGIAAGKPFLGICLGLQVLFTESEEFGCHKGLGVLSGRVKRLPFGGPGTVPRMTETADELKVPHIGWNEVAIQRPAPPLKGIVSGSHVYFVHSYYAEPSDPSIVCSVTDYGVSFVSSVWKDNIFACQFHPEKSQSVGLSIVRNFAQWR